MAFDRNGENLLYNLAYECEGHLNQLLEAVQKTESDVTTIELCADFQQRFAIWTAHLGVFARKSQSLDTRLQNHPDLQDLVARLLDILRHGLQQCVIETSSSQREEEPVLKSIDKAPPKASQIQTATLKSINDTFTRLNRLGVTIRQSNSSKIDIRIKKFAADLNLDSFACLCTNAVQTLYPGAHQSLKDYLSKSMTDRYARILFLNSRHKILETRRVLNTNLSTIDEVPSGETQTIVSANPLAREIENPVFSDIRRVPNEPSLAGLSSVDTHKIRSRGRLPDAASTIFHKTSSIQINQGKYPKPPDTKGGSGTMTCQWCSEPLDKKQLSERDWRRHIDRDLKPYICLSEGCPEAHPAYPTFDAWFKHMKLHDWRWYQQVYLTTSWLCPVCEPTKDGYSSPQGLYSHLVESHNRGFTNEALQAISRQSKIAQPRAWDDCLICCLRIEEQENKDVTMVYKRQKRQEKQDTTKSSRKNFKMASPHSHSSDSDLSDTSSDPDDTNSRQHRRQKREDRSKLVGRHIAAHLQELMLLTLRFAALQSDSEKLDDDVKSASEDTELRNNASEDTNRGKLSHLSSRTGVTMKDVDGKNNTEGATDPGDDVKDEAVLHAKLNFEFGLRQRDSLTVKDGDVLNNIAKWLPHITATEVTFPMDRISSYDLDRTGSYPLKRTSTDDFDLPRSYGLDRTNSNGTIPAISITAPSHRGSGSDRTLLFAAIEAGDKATINRLLEGGVNLETSNEFGLTPLWMAVLHGKADVIRVLIEHGASVEARNADGDDVLSWAVAKGRVNIIKMLGYK